MSLLCFHEWGVRMECSLGHFQDDKTRGSKVAREVMKYNFHSCVCADERKRKAKNTNKESRPQEKLNLKTFEALLFAERRSDQ